MLVAAGWRDRAVLIALVFRVVHVLQRAAAIRDVYAEPLSLQASAEVPIYISFTTGQHSSYDQPYEDDGSPRMLVSVWFEVACDPEFELCTYVNLGENGNCQKVLEAPALPLLRRCARGYEGLLVLELRATLQKETQYNLLILGTLPPAGKGIVQMQVRIYEPTEYLDISHLNVYEEASFVYNPPLVTQSAPAKHVTAFELITPVQASQATTLQQYTFKVAGSATQFARDDQIRIYSSPFFFADEGLSFGGACDGFNAAGFSNPLRDCTCEVTSVPSVDARVGFNVIVLTFGQLSTLGETAQYFRISLNTPKDMGSIGLWYAASKDASAANPGFHYITTGAGPFFVEPSIDIFHSMAAPAEPVYAVSQRLTVTIYPRLNILGDSSTPVTITINAPVFFSLRSCLRAAPTPEVTRRGAGADAYCFLKFLDNMNFYAHQGTEVIMDVENPPFAVQAQEWRISVQSGDGSMSTSGKFPAWPVYTALEQAYLLPLTMEYGQTNELQVYFRPSTTSPPEARALIVAPYGFLFDTTCAFEILVGFPSDGLSCSNPLSEIGHNLFSLRMPLMTAFEAGVFYGASIYPLSNPYPGSHAGLDDLPWRLDLVTTDGSEVLETMRSVPMGPSLRGFAVYPAAFSAPALAPSTRTPLAENDISISFRSALRVTVHGERLLITAPYSYRWKIGADVTLTSRGAPVRLAALLYEASQPPVADPQNQIELTLVNPLIPEGADMRARCTVLNAPMDASLDYNRMSPNAWIIEMYQPGAGYVAFEYRHQAVVFPGFNLQAITGGSVEAWLPLARYTASQVMVTFRLGTTLPADRAATLVILAPANFIVLSTCSAHRISPVHLEADGYTYLPAGSIASCTGVGRQATLRLTNGTEVPTSVLHALLIEALIPDTMLANNTWTVRSYNGEVLVEEEQGVSGFRLATEFLSVVYHPGTVDTGEDLRVGASDNRAMFSVQPAAAVLPGGTLEITAPYRFIFARDCRLTVYGAKDILDTLGSGLAGASLYYDLPMPATCLGKRNTARMTFKETLDVAIRYAFRISVTNPVEPHPADWPLPQSLWRFQTFDPLGAPLNADEEEAFFLWAFAMVSVSPLALAVTERTVATIIIEPSLTVPPNGFLLVTAPSNFIIPVPCVNFEPDTASVDEGVSPLPPAITCGRGPGGANAVKLQVDGFSYLAATVRFQFLLGVEHPAEPSATRDEGDTWSISSAETTQTGETYLERNPVVEGYPVHERLKSFFVEPNTRLGERVATVTFEVAIHDSMGTFDVLTTTEVSYLVVDMPMYFTVPVLPEVVGEPTVSSGPLHQCESFAPIYPEGELFPAALSGCLANPGAAEFRLRLTQNLLVGPDYRFSVDILHPFLNSQRQTQVAMVNYWQVRLARVISRRDVTQTCRSIEGYRVLPFLQGVQVFAEVEKISTNARIKVAVSFGVVSALSAAVQDSLRVISPASIRCLAGDIEGGLCELRVAGVVLQHNEFKCNSTGSILDVDLLGDTAIPQEATVQIDFEIDTGPVALPLGSADNLWTMQSLDVNRSVRDEAADITGFVVYPAFVEAELVPQDVSAMSYVNHAEFRFRIREPVPAGAFFVVVAPEGFALYPFTFNPSGLPSAQDGTEPTASQGNSSGEALVRIARVLTPGSWYSFHLTIGNPAVSPPQNLWILEIRGLDNETLIIDSRVEGFIVQSEFNTSLVEAQLDEPLAENYVHITVAFNQRLVADAVLSGSACVPTDEDPVCFSQAATATVLVVTAPEGFHFEQTCGYWVLARVGSKNQGLPPGSLCRADPSMDNAAHVQIALSLEPFTLYEFTLQVRNGLSVPLDNVWQFEARQAGVVRERNARVEGFFLRQFRTVNVLPATTLAGVVDNMITVQLRSERPLTQESILMVVAPVGFIFDPQQVTSSFTYPLDVELLDIESSVKFQLDSRDYLAPDTYFFVSIRARNPDDTPDPNFWYFYLQSAFLEHIDLSKYVTGFHLAHRMLYCQAYPNNVPWNYGSAMDLSMFFVTTRYIFTEAEALQNRAENSDPTWQITLVVPTGFSFPKASRYSDACSGFRRNGGKDVYDQLPQAGGQVLTCTVQTSRSVLIEVPATLVNETRYSFRINMTVAERREDVALQDTWQLTVLESGQILHLGNSPSPLLGTYYEAEWYWAGDSLAPR